MCTRGDGRVARPDGRGGLPRPDEIATADGRRVLQMSVWVWVAIGVGVLILLMVLASLFRRPAGGPRRTVLVRRRPRRRVY
jgi:hypothetical protein